MRKPSITRGGLRISTIEGNWASVHLSLTSGAFLTGFALLLGASDFQLGLIAAIPLLGQVLQVPGAFLVEKTGWRRGIVGWVSVVSRTAWLPMALAPFLWRDRAMTAFLALYLFSSLAMNVAIPGWVAWMSSLVPPALRGRYFGVRNRISGFFGIAATLAAGLVVDAFNHWQKPYGGYLVLQLAAVIAGWMAFRYILRQPDPGCVAEKMPPLARYMAQPMRDPDFRRVVTFNLYWLFAVGIGAPFFNPHLIKHMNWNFKGMALIGVIFSAATILSHPLWGRLMDRVGQKPVLMITAVGIVTLPFYYAFCPWTLRWPIYVNAAIGGFFWAGFGLGSFNLVLDFLPATGRAVYVGVLSAASGITTFLSCTVSGWLAERLSGLRWETPGLTVVNYQVLFVLTGLLRIPALFLLRRIQEPEAWRTSRVIRKALIEFNRRMGLLRYLFPYR